MVLGEYLRHEVVYAFSQSLLPHIPKQIGSVAIDLFNVSQVYIVQRENHHSHLFLLFEADGLVVSQPSLHPFGLLQYSFGLLIVVQDLPHVFRIHQHGVRCGKAVDLANPSPELFSLLPERKQFCRYGDELAEINPLFEKLGPEVHHEVEREVDVVAEQIDVGFEPGLLSCFHEAAVECLYLFLHGVSHKALIPRLARVLYLSDELQPLRFVSAVHEY